MDRAGLADESGSKSFQYPIGLDEGAPEAGDILRVVGCVHLILLERNDVRNLVGKGSYAGLEAKRLQPGEQLLVQIGHGARPQLDPIPPAVARADDDFVVQEIELDLEGPSA